VNLATNGVAAVHMEPLSLAAGFRRRDGGEVKVCLRRPIQLRRSRLDVRYPFGLGDLAVDW
jgi:hypothetical protein